MRLYNSITFVFFSMNLQQLLAAPERRIHTFSPNWLEVPSMQMIRFLPSLACSHGGGPGPDRDERSSVGTLLFATQ